jgi:CRP-like cAMP-binding protein
MLHTSIILVSFLDRFERELRDRLVALARPLRLEDGATLFRRGDSGGDIYVVESGALLVLDVRTRPETVLDLLVAGGVVGEMSFVEPEPRTAEVRARGETALLHWEKGRLLAELTRDHSLAAAFYRAVACVAVTRVRTVTSSALVASRPPAGDDLKAVKRDMRAAWAVARGDEPGDPAEALSASISRISAWLSQMTDPKRVTHLGALVRADMREALDQSRLGRALLAREPTPDTAWMAAAQATRADGRSRAGSALDRVLLDLPTFRGLRWRRDGGLDAVAESLPADREARVLAVHPEPSRFLGRLRATLATRGASLVRVEAAPPREPPTSVSGVAEHVAIRDLTDPGPLEPDQDVAVIDGLCDLLPDRLLVPALGRALDAVRPGGRLVLTAARASEDAPFVDHVLGWPILRRSPPEVSALLHAAGGRVVDLREPADPDVAGAVAIAVPV